MHRNSFVHHVIEPGTSVFLNQCLILYATTTLVIIMIITITVILIAIIVIITIIIIMIIAIVTIIIVRYAQPVRVGE